MVCLFVLFKQRRFVSLDSGCNGVIFIQMRKGDKDPSPKDIVQHMMTSAASTRKHMSRFMSCSISFWELIYLYVCLKKLRVDIHMRGVSYL